MKKYLAIVTAAAAFASLPAYAGDGVDPKECQVRCKEMLKAEVIKKEYYDYAAVQNDPTKSDAEKARSHKDAVKRVCRATCGE